MSKKISVISVILAVLLVASMFAGCSTAQETSQSPSQEAAESESTAATQETATTEESGSSGEGKVFGVMNFSEDIQFFNEVVAGIEEKLNPGDSIIVYPLDGDQTNATACFENFITKGVDMILASNTNDPTAYYTGMKMAADAGIPVVCWESAPEDPELCATTVLSDDYNCGYLAGKALCESLDGQGKVASYCRVSDRLGQTRLKGFEDACAEFEGIEHVYNIDIDEIDSETALSAIEDMLQRYPDIDGFWDYTENVTVAAVAAKKAGNYDFTITTVDATQVIRDFINEGTVLGGIYQQPYLIGNTVTETAYKYFDGETLDQEILVPVVFITEDNMDAVRE